MMMMMKIHHIKSTSQTYIRIFINIKYDLKLLLSIRNFEIKKNQKIYYQFVFILLHEK
jgi:hypothetical protein